MTGLVNGQAPFLVFRDYMEAEMKEKPGYKTTEFWTVMVNAVIMALVASGLMDSESAETMEAMAVTLIAAVLPMVLYVWSRTKVKTA